MLVDINKSQVTHVAQQSDRVITDTAESSVVHADVNMFVPKAILIDAGSAIRWSNPSNHPHNVIGTFNPIAVSDASNTTGMVVENSTGNNTGNTNNADAQVSKAI